MAAVTFAPQSAPAASGAPVPGSERAWQTVLAHVEAQLLDGSKRPGDRLDPERDLAASLGVGRSSVREALRVLEVMGLIRTGTGSGPTSGAIIVAAPQGGLGVLMRLQVAAQAFPIHDVVQTRLLLEGAVVEKLARVVAADPGPDFRPALDVLDAMDTPALPRDEFLALDARFHLALAEASGNAVTAAMMGGLRTAIESYVLERAAVIDDWDAVAARLRREHRGVVAAIRAGDAATARSSIHDHITRYYAD